MKEYVIAGIIAFIGLAGGLGFLYYKGKKAEVKKIILALVIEAEQKFAGGKLKFAFVTGKLYTLLPPVAKVFITEQTLEILIEEAVDQLKGFLAKPEPTPVVVKSAGVEIKLPVDASVKAEEVKPVENVAPVVEQPQPVVPTEPTETK